MRSTSKQKQPTYVNNNKKNLPVKLGSLLIKIETWTKLNIPIIKIKTINNQSHDWSAEKSDKRFTSEHPLWEREEDEVSELTTEREWMAMMKVAVLCGLIIMCCVQVCE